MARTPYPEGAFYVVDRLFHGQLTEFGIETGHVASSEWGHISDGPVTSWTDVGNLVLDSFQPHYDGRPTEDTLRVWLIHPDRPPENMTKRAIEEWKLWHERGVA